MIACRQERPEDYPAIRSILQTAFKGEIHSDGSEPDLVERLRLSPAYIADLALVCRIDGILAGYCMFSRVKIGSAVQLSLAPLAVLPHLQRRGGASALIRTGHQIALRLGFECVVVLGSPDFYARFGYEEAAQYAISFPQPVPSRYFMVKRLQGSGPLPQGIVEYPPEFGL